MSQHTVTITRTTVTVTNTTNEVSFTLTGTFAEIAMRLIAADNA